MSEATEPTVDAIAVVKQYTVCSQKAAELAGESIVRVDLHRERATDVEELHEREGGEETELLERAASVAHDDWELLLGD